MRFQYAAAPCLASISTAGTESIYAACILERLPVVVPSIPEWKLDYLIWRSNLDEKYYKKTLPSEFTDEKMVGEDSASARKWTPTPRSVAEDDANPHSLRRRLDQRIFLLIKDKKWRFPIATPDEGETMRSAAERVLQQTFDLSGAQTYFVGNAPAGHHTENTTTVFFQRAQLIQGEVTPIQSGVEYAWVAKDELNKYVEDASLVTLLSKML